MKKILFVLFLIVLTSCSFISKFYKIPNVIYGNWQYVADGDYCKERYMLYRNGEFEYYSIQDLSSVEPTSSINGHYSVAYDSYKVDRASGKITFSANSGENFSKNFFWRASQESGPIELIFFNENEKFTYKWSEVLK